MLTKKSENKNFIDVMECSTSFSIADCTMYIKQAMDAIKPGTASACREKPTEWMCEGF
jgi:hypothetical protein